MNVTTKLLAGGLLLLGAHRSGAQGVPARHYYVGLGGVLGNYQLSARQESWMAGPALVGGVRFSPRLALEASLAAHHSRTESFGTGLYHLDDPTASYQPVTFRNVYQQRTQALALVARYGLLRRPERRLQLDALLGAAVVHSDAYGYNSALDQATQALVFGQFYARYDVTGGCLLLGPSVRYRLASRVEMAAEYVANFAFGGQAPARVGRLAGTVGLSARYCFGRLLLPAAGRGEAR